MAHVDLRIDAHDVAFVPDGNDYVALLRLSVIHYMVAGCASWPLVGVTTVGDCVDFIIIEPSLLDCRVLKLVRDGRPDTFSIVGS